MNKVQVVILGAGKGKRMQSELPKVLIPVKGKPMVERLVDMAIQSGLTSKPIVVVSESNQQQIKDTLGDKCSYVVQKEQLGTAHAVFCTKELLAGNCDTVIVLNGDHPFVTENTLKTLVSLVNDADRKLAITTTKVPEFAGWLETFHDFGRIIRNEDGTIAEILEKKDANEDQLAIKEVNAAYYCFNAPWLMDHLAEIKNENSQKEFYLTDIVKLAIANRQDVASHVVDPVEAYGVNSPEQLQCAEDLMVNRENEAVVMTS